MSSLVAALLASVAVVTGPCPAASDRSCASPTRPRPTVWLLRQEDLLHELGHAFDYTYMDDGARARFVEVTGDDRNWGRPGDALAGRFPNPPRERFAEAFRMCAQGRRDAGAYGYEPTARQHRRACALIERIALARVQGYSRPRAATRRRAK